MKKLYKVFIITFLIFHPIFSFADTSQFIFSTDLQTVAQDVLSNKITIHSEIPVTETTYITLSSSSATGQFFSNTTSSDFIATGSYIYISSGNSNRTFYYKDTTAGDFVITADVWSKDKAQKLSSISQHISVGNPIGSSTTTQLNMATSTRSEETVTTSTISAHSSPSAVSTTEEVSAFEISAGRDRLAMVGNTLVFQAKPTKLKNVSEQNISYIWSFGDGSTAQGNFVSHIYKFAGDYIVVVNAGSSDKQAVSRLEVKVISPTILLTKVYGGIEVSNKSTTEVNLEGWSLSGATRSFIFPKDTLLPPGKKVIFGDDIVGAFSGVVSLINPIGQKFAITSEPINLNQSASTTLDAITAQINEVKSTISKMNQDREILVPNPAPVPVAVKSKKSKAISINPVTTTNSAMVFEAQKRVGIITKLLSWPIKGFGFVKHLFVEN